MSAPEPEAARQIRILALAHNRATALIGAGIWQMRSGNIGADLLGTTDAAGEATVTLHAGGLRIMARGYVPEDIPNPGDSVISAPLALHPGAYSGYGAGLDDAVWAPEGANEENADPSGLGHPWFHFTAFGLMRDAPDLATLEITRFRQYQLRHHMAWLPGPDPMLPRRGWCSLATRSYAYPATGQWVQRIEGLNEFRFPRPAVMIARNASDKRDVIYRLWN